MGKKLIIATVDTETASLVSDVYDVGYIIHDKKGNELTRYSALVVENFTNPKKMMGAYYAAKMFSHYAPMLDRSIISLVTFAEIAERMRSDFEHYGVNVIAAYNIGFDLRVLKNTAKEIISEPVLPEYRGKIIDIWQFCCEARLNSDKYRELAISRGWVSDVGNVRTGAEFAFRYSTGEFDFIEAHTALADCEIEIQLLKWCFDTRKKVPYGVKNAMPWRLVNPKPAGETIIT